MSKELIKLLEECSIRKRGYNTTNDLLIKELGEEIAKGVGRYLKKNNIKGSEVEISMELIENNDQGEMKVITTIHRRKTKVLRKGVQQ